VVSVLLLSAVEEPGASDVDQAVLHEDRLLGALIVQGWFRSRVPDVPQIEDVAILSCYVEVLEAEV